MQRGHLFAVAVIVALQVPIVAASAFDTYTPPRATEASLRPKDTRRLTSDFGHESRGTSTYEFAFLISCLGNLASQHAEEAVRSCSAAIELDQSNATAFKLRGLAYYLEHRHGDALRDMDRAASLDSKDDEIQAGRGLVLRALGRTDAALDAYSRAIALKPGVARWWNARCWTRAVARSRLELALHDCNRALELDARSAVAHDSRGLVFLLLGRPRDAIRDYTRAITLDPKLASSYFGRGTAKLRLADASGHDDIARARALDPAIDRAFAGYGVFVTSPAILHRPTVQKACKAPGCPNVAPLPQPRPPQADDVRTRSAGVDLDHGTQGTSR